jgi:predicted nucleic acid-binding protein
MPPFDLAGALRRLKPEKHASPLNRRNDAELAFVDDEPIAGAALLLDSTVYIDVLTGKTPEKVDQLLRVRTLYHSAVVVGELTNRLGARISRNKKEAQARAKLLKAINEIPDYRVLVPTVLNWGEAGIIAGIMARLGGYASGRIQDDLNDALIFLQARANGLAVLTANVGDFDRLEQLLPDVRILFYRAHPHGA